MKKIIKFLIIQLLIILLFSYSFSQIDAKIKLNSTAGATKFSVTDANDVSQFSVDSSGNLIVVGTATVHGNKLGFPGRGIIETSSMTIQLRAAGQEVVVNRSDGQACFVIKDNFNFYPRVWERRIYDDAENFLLAITTHTYVESLGIRTNQIRDSVGTRVITTASDALSNTTVTTIHGDLRINGNDILDSAGTARITLGAPVVIAGTNLRIGGNNIIDSAGATRIELGDPVTIGGTLRINDNDIQDSAGIVRITLGDTSTYSSTVTVRGLIVQGDLIIGEGRLSDNSITSADIKDGTIATADIGNRQVSSGKLLVTSTYTYAGGPWSTTSNAWATLGPLVGSLDVTAAPATIFLFFDAGPIWRSEGGQWTKIGFRFNVGGTAVGYAEAYNDDSGPNRRMNVGLNAAFRVTTPGTYTVSVQWRSGDDGGAWGTANCANASFTAFWVGSP